MTADELSEPLTITRTAVRQHLAALENNGLLKKGDTRASGGRPEQLYVLTEKGKESFARHYAWFAQLLVETIEQESGADGLSERLSAMGTSIGTKLRSQHPELVKTDEKIAKLAEIMDEMGYSAQTANSNSGKIEFIEADNCVFHTLALSNPKVCQFDLALLSAFTGETVDHQQCMATGDHICRFKFAKPKK